MFAKDFFRDRLVILLGLSTIALTFLNIFFVIFRVDLDQVRIVFRHWLVNGNSQFYASAPTYFYTFIAVVVLVLLSSWIISYKIYDSFKPGAYFAFSLAVIVLVASLSVLGALFRL